MALAHWLSSFQLRPFHRQTRRTAQSIECLEDRIAPGDIAFAAASLSVLPDLVTAELRDDPWPASRPDRGGRESDRSSAAIAEDSHLATFESTTAPANVVPQSTDPTPRPAVAVEGNLDIFADAALTGALLDDIPAATPPQVQPSVRQALPTTQAPKGGGASQGGSTPSSGGGGGAPGLNTPDDSHFVDPAPVEAAFSAAEGEGGEDPPPEAWVSAENDYVEVQHGGIIDAPNPGVMHNDETGPYGATVTLISGPSKADPDAPDDGFKLNPDGSFVYYSLPGSSGGDSFTYELSSGAASDTAIVFIAISNGEPEGQPNGYAALDSVPLEVSVEDGLLVNDSEGEGQQQLLEVVSNTQPVDENNQTRGSVSVSSDGSFVYTPEEGWWGTVTFTYQVGDGVNVNTNPVPATIDVNSLHVFHNGDDISVQARQTVIGKQASLSVGFAGPGWSGINLPDPLIQNVQWTIPGETVKSYTLGDEPVHLAAADLTQQTLVAYWIDQTDAEITVQATIFGAAVTARGYLDVEEPGSSFTSVTTTATPPVNVRTNDGFTTLPTLRFGIKSSPGITWTAEVTAGDEQAGEISLVQTVDTYAREVSNTAGPRVKDTNGVYALDDPEGTGFYPSGQEGAPPVGAVHDNETAQYTSNDSPRTILVGLTAATREDRFKSYLMYRPSGGDNIWVTLKRMDWYWKGSAQYDGTVWSVVPNSTGSSTNPTGTDSTDLPIWGVRVQDIPMEDE